MVKFESEDLNKNGEKTSVCEQLKSDFRECALTKRGLFTKDDRVGYFDIFKISENDFDDPNALILDLGAGMQQEFAREVKKLGLKSKIISVDPRLGLSEEEDLSLLPKSERQERLEGRKNVQPMSVAATSEALPFKEGSFDKIYALYSVPYYLKNSQEIKTTLEEMIRTLKSGGIIKAFPVDKNQIEAVKKIVSGISGIEFNATLKDKYNDYGEDWLIEIKKK
jgi:ubiquinone/menaquinone biosynthesis C-methylase UbiE